MALLSRSASDGPDNIGIEIKNNELINTANHCLLYKDFDKCLDLCLRGIGTAKNYPEHPGSTHTLETLCILATQAYAELDRWQEVLPFITQLYNGIEDCPARVVQLCILLHAHMHDFTTCSAIAHIWLRNPNNVNNNHYAKLTELFITRVLQRQNRLTDVPAFLDSCPGLKTNEKEILKRYALRKENELKETALHKDNPKEMEAKKIQSKQGDEVNEPQGLLNKLCKTVARFIPPTAWYLIKRIAVISIFIYWILTRANFDLLSNERLMGIFSNLLRLWRSMFAPYHTAK